MKIWFKILVLNFLLIVLAFPIRAYGQTSSFGHLLNDSANTENEPSGFGILLLPTPTPITGKTPEVKGISTANNAPAKMTVAVLGDSMIDTLQTEMPQLQSALEKYFPETKFKIYNFGVGASNLEYALYRLTHEYDYLWGHFPSVFSVNPDILVLESFAYNNFGDSQEGLDKQWSLISEIVAKTEELSPKTRIILAATIAPNSFVFGNGIDGINWSQAEKITKANTIKKYLQNLINFATSQHYPLADAFRPSLDNNGEGKIAYINAGDNLHPSGPGGEFFCQKVAEAIKTLIR